MYITIVSVQFSASRRNRRIFFETAAAVGKIFGRLKFQLAKRHFEKNLLSGVYPQVLFTKHVCSALVKSPRDV